VERFDHEVWGQVSVVTSIKVGEVPLLLRRVAAEEPAQSLTSHTTIVLSFPPVTKVALSLYMVKPEARIKPLCALKVVMVS
jgi:hypothetical protein